VLVIAAIAVAYAARRPAAPETAPPPPGPAVAAPAPAGTEEAAGEILPAEPLIVDGAAVAPPPVAAPSPGSLEIRSEPSGARVFVDGSPQGVTPMRLTLAPGRYDVRLSREGFADARRTASVSAGATARVSARLTADARPAGEGTLRVTVRPWGDVYVDGVKRLDQASHAQTLSLPPGRYTVAAVHPSLGRSEQRVTVTAGQQASFDADLRPAEITVTAFDSTGAPMRGEIFVDGASTGRWTPSVISVPLGQHQFEVRGTERRSRSVSVTRGVASVRL
jgi:hypothetical protein